MPPKKRQEFDLANMDDYQQLFETQQESATARIRREQEIAKKRRKLLNQSAILTVGPKFRDDQITRFRGTNSRVIQSEAREDGTLFDSIVDGKVIICFYCLCTH